MVTDTEIVRKWLETVSEDRVRGLRELLSRAGIPTDRLAKYWGGGVRLKKLSKPAFLDGAARAFTGEQFFRRILKVWSSNEIPLSSAVGSAAFRWPHPDVAGSLAPAGINWVTGRFQPSALD